MMKILAMVLLVIAAIFSGCATAPAEGQPQSPGRSHSESLLEVVTIVNSSGNRTSAVLTRGDIIATVGAEPGAWKDITLPRERLIETLRRTRFGTPEKPGRANYAELFVSGSLIHKRYSLAELRLNDARELLERFFEKRGEAGGGWWIRKVSAASDAVEENGLIALLKSLGFEAMRTDIAPVLFVRPPPELR